MEFRIREAVAQALAKRGAEHVTFMVEWPTDMAHGDFAVNAALAASKQLGINPRQLAEELVPELAEALGDAVSGIEVAGPGFINFFLARTVFTEVLDVAGESEWGTGTLNQGVRTMVEYTDPNPFKQMHIGHLMSNTIGEAISRLIENSGSDVARANYQGDVGPHVARALWALQKAGVIEPVSAQELGDAYVKGNKAAEESPEAKAEIDAINKAVYAGEDHDLMELWRKGREVSLTAFEEIYKVLGTKFDYYFFESECSSIGTDIVQSGLERGVFELSDGAIVYKGEEKGLHTRVFITSHNTPTYDAKELGLAILKEERWPSDRSIILTAAEQTGHFEVVLAAMQETAPLLGAKTTHIPHGFLKLATGKMSSREGNVILAADLINSVIEKASEKNTDPIVAEQVAIGALKYMILRQAPGGDIIFDFDKSLSLEGDSGPYLQYAYVRALSILNQKPVPSSIDEIPEAPYTLERMLVRFPKVLEQAEQNRAPHHVVQYLTQLAGEWNSFYAQNRILDAEYESYKLLLVRAFVNTMKKGMWVLGMPAPEKM